MPDWIALPLIVIACFIPGWLTLRLFHSGAWDVVTRLFTSVTLGVLGLGWLAFVLAELGWFSIGRLAFLWLLICGLLLFCQQRVRPENIATPHPPPAPADSPLVTRYLPLATLLLWLIAALWLFFRPHEYVLGGGDAGVYVNLGAAIAQTGGIQQHDALLAQLEPTLRPALLRSVSGDEDTLPYLMPAFYADEAGQITPRFYHSHPVWLAVAFGLTGSLQTELLLNGLWVVLAVLAVYLIAHELWGWPTAVLALFALTFNALTIWFARYPTAEPLSLYLLWAGLWSGLLWLNGRHPLFAFIAGAALGQLFLARIDALFLLPFFGLFWLWRGLRGWHKKDWYFTLPFVALVTHSLIHAFWQSRPYFDDLFGYALLLLRNYWLAVVVAAVIGFGLLLLMSSWRGQWVRVQRYQKPALGLALVLIAGLALYAWFVRPYVGADVVWHDPYSTTAVPQINRDNLLRLSWYISPLSVWLGVMGLCLLVWQMKKETAVLLVIPLFFLIFYQWNVRANPHQIYVMRRFLLSVPLLVLTAVNLFHWLLNDTWRVREWRLETEPLRLHSPLSTLQSPNTWSTTLTLLLLAAWLGSQLWSARGFISQVDNRGLLAQVEAFNAQLDPHSVLLFSEPHPIGIGDFFGTPLRFTFGHDVFKLYHPEALAAAVLASTIEEWQNNGRTIYWIGDPAWLLQHNFTFTQTTHYISSQHLERIYDHKPTAVQTTTWELPVAKLEN